VESVSGLSASYRKTGVKNRFGARIPEVVIRRHQFNRQILMNSSKVDFAPFCHSVLDTESSEFRCFWIPAFAGMTVFGLLTSSSILTQKIDKMAAIPGRCGAALKNVAP
jgi:hypothetical protein